MKSVLYGLAAMVVISLIAWAVLDSQSSTSAENFVSQNDSVRLD